MADAIININGVARKMRRKELEHFNSIIEENKIREEKEKEIWAASEAGRAAAQAFYTAVMTDTLIK